MAINKIIKRDGRVEAFKKEKIANAVRKAIVAVKGIPYEGIAETLAGQVAEILEKKYGGKKKLEVPSVENVQDVVERVLIENKLVDVAKAYILYRKKREEIRVAKQELGVRDELKLNINALKVLKKRYLLKDEFGRITETPAQLFHRVAHAIALVDKKYGASVTQARQVEREFYETMAGFEFLPNTPTLMNAGTQLGQLSACFVLPIGDSLKEIFDTLKYTALIHQSGGGTGFSFSRLRPKGDFVKSTFGVASGPVSFMRLYDAATEQIKQGGKRRGANMGILRFDHPDVLEFIQCKSDGKSFRNFNISVAVTSEFMKKALKGEEYDLINPRTRKAVGRLNARELFGLIVFNAWKTGDPGLIFIDEVNKKNPTKYVGEIEATNPCGEIGLHAFEACNLGSINLGNFIEEQNGRKQVDFNKLRKVVWGAAHFLDNVIDASKFPIKEIDEAVSANRRIGLGVMGFADLLAKLGIPYNSEKALRIGGEIMKFIDEEGIKASQALARKRGSFPNFKKSSWYRNKGFKAMRNATVTTVAPTGTISIIAGCSSGIEPLFAIAFARNVLEGTRLLEVNKEFEQAARKRGFYSEELMHKIARVGSIQKINEIPADVRRVFVTALDITPEWHVRMQAVFQKHAENSVSKTINLPANATPNEVKKSYLLAWRLRCKGITVYRYGSKEEQVLTYAGEATRGKEVAAEQEHVSAGSEFSGGCPAGVECIF